MNYFVSHASLWLISLAMIVAAVIDGWKLKVPNWLTSNSGRRPMRSDMRPRIGPAISWQKAYVETSRPTTDGDAPNFSA